VPWYEDTAAEDDAAEDTAAEDYAAEDTAAEDTAAEDPQPKILRRSPTESITKHHSKTLVTPISHEL